MKRVFRYSFGLVLLIVMALFVGGEGLVEAQPNLNARLRGDYAANGSLACVQSSVAGSAGFGTNLVLVDPATTRTFSVQGILSFDGFGTGTFTDGTALTVFHDRTATNDFPVSQSEFTCDLTYVVNPDGSFTFEAECDGSVVAGGGVGTTFTITDIIREGHIAQGGRTLLLNHTTADVETFTSGSNTFKRICNRSGTAVKIRNR